jgi:iron only hydrogenase large subunit-like protein
MQFSGAIKLGGGLDDYLAPAQNCVLPLIQTAKSASNTTGKISMSATTDSDPLAGLLSSLPTSNMQGSSQSDVPGSGFTQMKSDGDKAKITLADCLSCSGCVTTAESILIAQHSSTHLLEVLNAIQNRKNDQQNDQQNQNIGERLTSPPQTGSKYDSVVVSISLSSLLSISALLEVDLTNLFQLLTLWFKQIGVEEVLYSLDAQSQALYIASLEFEARYRNLSQKNNFILPTKPNLPPFFDQNTPTLTPAQTLPNQPNPTPSHIDFAMESIQSHVLPLIASECPGWVCVSEKTQGTKMIKFMSSARSPQSILGIYAKGDRIDGSGGVKCGNDGENTQNNRFFINPRVFHVSIQPCYDKKLEATREVFEFNNTTKDTCCQGEQTDQNNTTCCQDEKNQPSSIQPPIGPIPYVDLVLSTHELVDMLVNNIQIVSDSETSTTDPSIDLSGPELPRDTSPGSITNTNTSNKLTPLVVSQFWVDLWVKYSQNNLNLGQIDPNNVKKRIYRVPGFNTSSGGYAEAVLGHGLEHLFGIKELDPNYLHSLQWASVANNDINAVLVEYLGTGVVYDKDGVEVDHGQQNDPKNDPKNVGIYAIIGKNGTIITHGVALDQKCTANGVGQSVVSNVVVSKPKVKIGFDDEDDLFSKKISKISETKNEKISETKCSCVSCNPMFKVNMLKYKQIKNKTITYTTINQANSPSQSTHNTQINPIENAPKTRPTVVKLSSLDDEDDLFAKPSRNVNLDGVGEERVKKMGFNIDDEELGVPMIKTKLQSVAKTNGVIGGHIMTTASFIEGIKNNQQNNPKNTHNTFSYRLTSPLPSPICVLSTCTAFGLRNVQAIVQQHTQTSKIKGAGPIQETDSVSSDPNIQNRLYHYVEVMSCPSGCTNGGAQLTAMQIKTSRGLLNDAVKEYFGQSGENDDQSDENDAPEDQTLLSGILHIETSKDAQITQQKALLEKIRQSYQELPFKSNLFDQNDYKNQFSLNYWINNANNAISLLFTKFNPVVVNEELTAMRW